MYTNKITHPYIPSPQRGRQEGPRIFPSSGGVQGWVRTELKMSLKWFKLNRPAHSIVLIFLALLIGYTNAYAQQSPFEQLKEKFENGEIFQADFTHRYVDSYTQDTVENSGEIWVGKKQYKVDAPNQLVAVNGDVSKVYDSARNRLIVSTYVSEEDDFAPSRILNGIDSTYTIEQQKKTGNSYEIILSSDDPFALFQTVKITLNDNHIPVEIFVKDPADNLITTTFSDGSFINRQKDFFELEYPANAEIIDMRN